MEIGGGGRQGLQEDWGQAGSASSARGWKDLAESGRLVGSTEQFGGIRRLYSTSLRAKGYF